MLIKKMRKLARKINYNLIIISEGTDGYTLKIYLCI